MSTNDLIDECREVFEKWIKDDDYLPGYDPIAVASDGEYRSEGTRLVWAAWQAAWNHRQKKIDEMENTMVAMSDSLGAMANS